MKLLVSELLNHLTSRYSGADRQPISLTPSLHCCYSWFPLHCPFVLSFNSSFRFQVQPLHELPSWIKCCQHLIHDFYSIFLTGHNLNCISEFKLKIHDRMKILLMMKMVKIKQQAKLPVKWTCEHILLLCRPSCLRYINRNSRKRIMNGSVDLWRLQCFCVKFCAELIIMFVQDLQQNSKGISSMLFDVKRDASEDWKSILYEVGKQIVSF